MVPKEMVFGRISISLFQHTIDRKCYLGFLRMGGFQFYCSTEITPLQSSDCLTFSVYSLPFFTVLSLYFILSLLSHTMSVISKGCSFDELMVSSLLIFSSLKSRKVNPHARSDSDMIFY